MCHMAWRPSEPALSPPALGLIEATESGRRLPFCRADRSLCLAGRRAAAQVGRRSAAQPAGCCRSIYSARPARLAAGYTKTDLHRPPRLCRHGRPPQAPVAARRSGARRQLGTAGPAGCQRRPSDHGRPIPTMNFFFKAKGNSVHVCQQL